MNYPTSTLKGKVLSCLLRFPETRDIKDKNLTTLIWKQYFSDCINSEQTRQYVSLESFEKKLPGNDSVARYRRELQEEDRQEVLNGKKEFHEIQPSREARKYQKQKEKEVRKEHSPISIHVSSSDPKTVEAQFSPTLRI